MGQMELIDDYGHHPSEVDATITAMRNGWPEKRLVMVYQPHRYTRTRDLYEEFVDVLSKVDCLLLLDVYAAGEVAILTADSKSLARSIRQRGQVDPIYVPSAEKLPEILETVLQDQDMLIMQGAGNIGVLARQIADDERLNRKENS